MALPSACVPIARTPTGVGLMQDWGPAIKQAQVLKRAVKAWLNEDRVSRGLKEIHSNVSSLLGCLLSPCLPLFALSQEGLPPRPGLVL